MVSILDPNPNCNCDMIFLYRQNYFQHYNKNIVAILKCKLRLNK